MKVRVTFELVPADDSLLNRKLSRVELVKLLSSTLRAFTGTHLYKFEPPIGAPEPKAVACYRILGLHVQ